MRNYPFKMQLSENDCGAACVSMMIKKMCGIDLPIGTVKNIIHNTDGGSTFIGIQEGLKELEIDGEVAELQNVNDLLDELREHIVLTQIKRDNKVHYVLIYKGNNNKLLLADPAEKRVKTIRVDQLLKKWIPYVYYIKNIGNMNCIKKVAINSRYSIGISRIFFKNKWKILGIWLMSLMITSMTIFSTFSLTFFFDAIIPLKLIGIIPYITLIFFIVLLLQGILNILSTKIAIRLNNTIDLNITDSLLNNILNKEFDIMEQYKEGEIITYLQNVSQIREKYLYWIIRFPVDLLMMGLTIYLLLDQNRTMVLLLVIPIVSSLVLVCMTNDSLRNKSLSLYNKGEGYNNIVLCTIRNIGMIKTLSTVNYYKNVLIDELRALKNENERFLMYSTFLSSVRGSILSIFSLILLSVGAYYVIVGKLGSGTLLMFNSLSMQVMNPFMSIANLQSTYEQGKIAELKYKDVLCTKTYHKFGSEELQTVDSIEVKDLSFEYQMGIQVLKGVNIVFHKMKSYAITGASGVGKTTFAKIIATYYWPSNGKIEINGVSMEKYKMKELQKKIIYVPQNVEILPTSIMDNILMGRTIPQDVVISKAKKIGFDSIVDELPNGYETIIGNNGVKLSMGQMQLLNILRVTLIEYQVVIFDEITNGLDSNYRNKVVNYFTDYGNINIFITHDFEFASSCDFVYDLEYGKLSCDKYMEKQK